MRIARIMGIDSKEIGLMCDLGNVNVRDMARHEILKQVQDDNNMVWNDDIAGRNESHFCCPVVCK